MDTSKESGEPEVAQRDLIAGIEEVTNKDHDLTVIQAFKVYLKAIAWSAVLSAALIMDGYDFKLFGLLVAQPAFNEKYGNLQPDGTYQISAAWQSGLTNGSNIGQMVGLYLAGYLSDKLGFRRSMMITLLVIPFIIFLQFFAPSLAVLEVGQVLLGIPLGILDTITCVYAVEVAPTCLRAFLTSYVSQNWVIGQIVAACVLRGILNDAQDIDKTVTLMVLTTEHEREAGSSTTFAACFQGTDLRRTIIVMGCYCMQIIAGTTLRAYSTYFFVQAGLSTTQAFNMSIVTYVLSFLGTCVMWCLMPYVGRRTLFISGLVTLCIIDFTIGGLGVPKATSNLSWAIASLLVVSAFVSYLCSVPVIFALVAEIPSSLLRSKSVAIARFSYTVLNIAANVLTPYQLNPSAWGWGAKSGFFWGGSCILGLIFAYFVVPEPKDKRVAELDLLFKKKVSARKFTAVRVDVSEVARKTG
ncbi:MFS transporter, SP family, general alpha glucoside:H+ symporter [Purpureocillium lilacinum]|uniref:MFS transporter, SP family, general alpha glucoside:H+ symporter n=1 Tax=Purpureocillium lilacinum TaxID=33203 RepID=A0A179GJD9_PURLI|nr:MFS transporter, SP family, general alpha glucoside:H+ symporter [Purpureocillium lilacinum]OAQ77974.1 MFS transporter, SP family, general alpha glucoside:H+ symporter [Purpureocillium lilacinum]